jgi:hypothetical protein
MSLYDWKRKLILLLVSRSCPFLAHVQAAKVYVIGVLCGSSDLNERFREFALLQLEGATIEWGRSDYTTIEQIVDGELMPHFEDAVKRVFSYTGEKKKYEFFVRGLLTLRENQRYKQQQLVLS